MAFTPYDWFKNLQCHMMHVVRYQKLILYRSNYVVAIHKYRFGSGYLSNRKEQQSYSAVIFESSSSSTCMYTSMQWDIFYIRSIFRIEITYGAVLFH